MYLCGVLYWLRTKVPLNIYLDRKPKVEKEQNILSVDNTYVKALRWGRV